MSIDPTLITTISESLVAAYNHAVERMERPSRTMPKPEPRPESALPPPRVHRKAATPRVYASKYVGVTTFRKNHYVALWMDHGKDRRGPIRERTERGERWAAQDRARALGLEYLEMRDGEKIPYLWKERRAA